MSDPIARLDVAVRKHRGAMKMLIAVLTPALSACGIFGPDVRMVDVTVMGIVTVEGVLNRPGLTGDSTS